MEKDIATIDTISSVNVVRNGRIATILARIHAAVPTWQGKWRLDAKPAARDGQPGFWAQFFRVRRSRRGLADLDDRMLRDIGVSRADALHEAGRWRWDRQW